VSDGAYEEALRFIDALPSDVPAPAIAVEPDGALGIEWTSGPGRVFVTSVNGTNILAYAGILGRGTKTHGTEVFDGTIPQQIVGFVRRVFEERLPRQ
jgi:hypothetical protein